MKNKFEPGFSNGFISLNIGAVKILKKTPGDIYKSFLKNIISAKSDHFWRNELGETSKKVRYL